MDGRGIDPFEDTESYYGERESDNKRGE